MQIVDVGSVQDCASSSGKAVPWRSGSELPASLPLWCAGVPLLLRLLPLAPVAGRDEAQSAGRRCVAVLHHQMTCLHHLCTGVAA